MKMSKLNKAIVSGESAASISKILSDNQDGDQRVNYLDLDGRNSAHLAARYNQDIKVFQVLVNYGVDLNARDKDNLTPFFEIAKHPENLELVDFMVDNSVDINATCNDQYTPTMYVIKYSSVFDLDLLATVKHFKRCGADIELSSYNGVSPLHLTCQKPENIAITKFLLDIGVTNNINSEGAGSTPIHWAMRNEDNFETVDLLIKKRANINTRDNLGITPLLKAADYSNPKKMVKHLVLLGADTDAKDQYGNTVFKILEKSGNKDLIDWIKKNDIYSHKKDTSCQNSPA